MHPPHANIINQKMCLEKRQGCGLNEKAGKTIGIYMDPHQKNLHIQLENAEAKFLKPRCRSC